ncbi:unnamed protein product [Meloidogyne enterolobii]|uniref:Uncharacterized protein n=1 Tax=Meloidogyne enterolobii TaxID=390850 RepID=A0ACB0Y2Q7_MELEN
MEGILNGRGGVDVSTHWRTFLGVPYGKGLTLFTFTQRTHDLPPPPSPPK